LSNAEFALSVESENPDLVDRIEAERAKRARSVPTVPMTLSMEKKTNPFFRPADATFMTRHFAGQSPENAFKQLRQKRDTWKS
jgi:hydroxyacylglutathione hydrolase